MIKFVNLSNRKFDDKNIVDLDSSQIQYLDELCQSYYKDDIVIFIKIMQILNNSVKNGCDITVLIGTNVVSDQVLKALFDMKRRGLIRLLKVTE